MPQDNPFDVELPVAKSDNPFDVDIPVLKKKDSKPEFPNGGATLKNGYDFSPTPSGTEPAYLNPPENFNVNTTLKPSILGVGNSAEKRADKVKALVQQPTIYEKPIRDSKAVKVSKLGTGDNIGDSLTEGDGFQDNITSETVKPTVSQNATVLGELNKQKPVTESKGIMDKVSQALYLPALNQAFSEAVTKPLAGATDFVDRTIDKAYTTLTGEKTPDWLRKGGAFDKIVNHYEDAYQKRDKPTNLVSEITEGAVGTIPLIAALSLGTGEANMLSKAPETVGKLTGFMGATGFLNGYKEASDEGKGYIESFGEATKEGGKKALEGAGMEAQIMLGGAMGKRTVDLLKDKGINVNKSAEAILHALGLGTVFAGTSAGDDLIQGKDIDTRNVAKQMGMGVAFGLIPVVKGIGEDIRDNKVNKDLNDRAVQAGALASTSSHLNAESALRTLIATPKEQLLAINELPNSKEELYANSIENGIKAYDAKSPEEKRSFLTDQLIQKTQGDVKLMSEKINKNYDDIVNEIQNSTELPEEAKADLMDKVNSLKKIKATEYFDEATNTIKVKEEPIPKVSAEVKARLGKEVPEFVGQTEYPYEIYKGGTEGLQTDGEGHTFFTRDKEIADYYTSSREEQGLGKGKTSKAVVITKNPLIIDATEPAPDVVTKDGKFLGRFGQKGVMDKVKEEGYDAIIINKRFGDHIDGWEVVALDKKQIKEIKEEPTDAIQEPSTTESVLRDEGIRGEGGLQGMVEDNQPKVTPEESVTEEVQVDEVKPIRQLGTGANVYFETDKHRVNDNIKNGNILLNIGGKESDTPIAHIEFDSPSDAIKIAERINTDYPEGVPDAVLVDKYVEGLKKELLGAETPDSKSVSESISELFDKAQSEKSSENKRSKVEIAPVSEVEAEKIKDAIGIDVEGYVHTIDNSAINHIINEHGSDSELQRGQIPITKEDFSKISEIISSPDKVTYESDTKEGRPVIKYTKRFNGTTYFIEEVRTGRKELATKTMYKKKSGEVLPSTEVDPLLSTPEATTHTKVQKPKSKTKNRTDKVLGNEPNSFREALLQFFLGGGKLSTEDFIRLTGFKKNSQELRRAKFFGKVTDKAKGGLPADKILLEHIPEAFQKDGGMDLISEIADMAANMHKSEMLTELENSQKGERGEMTDEEAYRYGQLTDTQRRIVDMNRNGEITDAEMDAIIESENADRAHEIVDHLYDKELTQAEIQKLSTILDEFTDENGNTDWAKIETEVGKEGLSTLYDISNEKGRTQKNDTGAKSTVSSDDTGSQKVSERKPSEIDAKIAEAERTVKAKEHAVKTLEQQYEKLSKSLSENLKENQASIFENKTQSLFDDKGNQSKIVSDKKAELDNAKKELVKAQDDLQRVSDSKNQLEIEDNNGFKQSDNGLFQKVENSDGTYRQSRIIETNKGIKAKRVSKFIAPLGENSVGIEIEYKSIEDAIKQESAWLNEGKKSDSPLQSAKEKLAEAKAKLDKLNKNLGIIPNHEQKAKAFYDYHKALVSVAKEYIKEGIQDVQSFAKELGEKVSKVIQDAWDEATGGKEKTLADFENLDTVTQDELNTLGITIEQTRLLREQLGEEQYEYETKKRAVLVKEAQQLMAEGYSVSNLIKRIDKGYIPKDAEIELIRQYFVSLTARINNSPTPELLAERKEIMETLDLLKTRAGRTVQAFDGLIAVEDNLASFLQDEGKYYELSPEEVKELTDKYNKAKEALEKLQAKEAEAIERERNKLAQKKINEIRSQKRALVKEDFKKERTILVQSIREKLREIRNTPAIVPLPYARELVAIAPEVRKLVQSHIDEKIYDLKEIIKSIHSDLKDDIDGLTEGDIRDIIAGQYPNPRNTKNSKLAQIRDLETQARLERKIELLEQGIMETKNPTVRQAKSDQVTALEKQIKEIKRRNPDLTAPSKLQSRKTWYGNKIKELKGQIAKGEYDPVEPPHPIVLDAEALKLKDEYAKFLNETRERRARKDYDAQSKLEQVWHRTKQALEVKRLVQTSIDLSIPLRQGISIMLNPRTTGIGAKGYGKMLNQVFNEKNYQRMMYDIKSNPFYLESKDDGIIYTETSSRNPEMRDESHPHESFVYKIPFLGAPFRASERAAAAWTNYARFELYQRGVKFLQAQGKTRENSKEAYEQMAARVMVDTGRGKIPFLDDKSPSKTDTRIKGMLGTTFYGTRLYSSTFRKLNPLYYLNPKVDKTVRVQALKDMAGYVTSQILLHTAVAAALGATVSLDWDDPDFMKLRIGKRVIDLTAGQSVYIRTFLRLVNAVFNHADPTVSHDDAVKYSNFAKKSLETFWRNKLAPNTAYGVNAFMGENTIGEKFDPYEIIKIYPMYTDDIIQAFKDGSPLDAAMILPIGISGLGYQEYSKDIRKARVSTYLEPKDKELKSFLKKHQLNIQGDINQEVYNIEAGANVKMTKEQSDNYEKIWSDYIITGLKDKMPELDKMKDEDFIKEVSKIKTQATKYAKEQITGINQELLGEIKDDDKKEWKLSPEQVKAAAEIYHKFLKQHENEIEQTAKDAVKYDEPKPTLIEARRRAERALKSEAVSEAKYQILQKKDFKKKAIPVE